MRRENRFGITTRKHVKRISRKQYNKEINEAIARIEKGDSVSHNDVLKELSRW